MKVSSTLAILPGAGLVAARAMSADGIVPRQVAALNQLQSRVVHDLSCDAGKDQEIIAALESCEKISGFVSVATNALVQGGVIVPGNNQAKTLLQKHFDQIQLTEASVTEIGSFFSNIKTQCEQLRIGGGFVLCAGSNKECADGPNKDQLYDKGKDIFAKGKSTYVCPVMFKRGQLLCGNYGPLTQKFIDVAIDAELKSRAAANPGAQVAPHIVPAALVQYAKAVQMMFCEYKYESLRANFNDRPSIAVLDASAFNQAQVDAVQVRFTALLDAAGLADFNTLHDKLKAELENNEKSDQATLERIVKDLKEKDDAQDLKEANEKEAQENAIVERVSAKLIAEFEKNMTEAVKAHEEKYKNLLQNTTKDAEEKSATIDKISKDLSALEAEKAKFETDNKETAAELEAAKKELTNTQSQLTVATDQLVKATSDLQAAVNENKQLQNEVQEEKTKNKILDLHSSLLVKGDAAIKADELEKKISVLERKLALSTRNYNKVLRALGEPTVGNDWKGGHPDDGKNGLDNGLDKLPEEERKGRGGYKGHGVKSPVEPVLEGDCDEVENDEDNAFHPKISKGYRKHNQDN